MKSGQKFMGCESFCEGLYNSTCLDMQYTKTRVAVKVMYILCALKSRSSKSATSRWFWFTLRFYSSLVVSLGLFCFIICPFSLAKNTCCTVSVTDHRRWNLLPALDSIWNSSNTIRSAQKHTRALDHNGVGRSVFATVCDHVKMTVCVC